MYLLCSMRVLILIKNLKLKTHIQNTAIATIICEMIYVNMSKMIYLTLLTNGLE